MSNLNPNAKEMLEMRVNGATLQEIADYYNISRQAVHSVLNNYTSRLCGKRCSLDVNDIIYKGIYDYFRSRPEEGILSLSKKVFGKDPAGKTRSLKSCIVGEHKMYFTVDQIKKLCEVVGKPFEEVFELRGEEE
jgi:hypothetical protein